MDIAEKMAEFQTQLIEAVKAANEEQVKSLKEEIADLKKKASRFTVSSEEAVYGLKEAAAKVCQANVFEKLSKRQGVSVEIGKNPYDLYKAVTYNPGAQSVSGDIRMVHAITNRPGIIQMPMRPPSILDLLISIPTTSEFIAYTRETSTTNNAAYVADAALKPTSSVALVVERAMIETIAHTIKVPLQLAKDVNSFQAYLEKKLVDMLRVKSEDAYLYGNGTSPNIKGITLFTGIQTYAQTSTSTNRIDTIRQALNKLENSWYPWADAIMLHPNDVCKMELLKDAEGRYLWPTFGSFATGYNNKSLFGVPIVSTTAITEGTFLVGNFSQGVTRYQREDVTVDIAFENEDDFMKNLMCIRVESRECLVPEDAKCFVLGTFLGGDYN